MNQMSTVDDKNFALPKIRGTFSARIIQEIGTGSTKRKVVQSFLYYGEENDNSEIILRPLNDSHIPSGPEQIISKDELLESFTPEVELYTNSVFPAMKELGKTLAKADRQRQLGNIFTAEMEYNKALNIDENNIRANFGIGLCYLERNEEAKALDIFNRLISLDAAFGKEHKHLFNDFGISLRKNKMFSEAIEFYSRALNFSSDDENLFFNIARSFCELGKIKESREYLEKCLAINPDFTPGKKLSAFLNKK
ncbi:tetratricopeptide repeat protein [Maridesulfovibrio ferrireducens]|uniref:tetratricopeptide repeat protein n=1 Tax=Maridesulfovibrio ferrireducens TaxID=246191 RepID=UPI0026F2BFFC|nr:tetratricopeptide repeat protein [Maridesulfovibrio ferrireducens]